MATALDPALSKKTFINWLKGALAILFAREGLTEFVKKEISDFQRDLLNSIFIQNGIPPSETCSSCTTANMLKCPTQDFCDIKRPCKQHDSTVNNKAPNQKCPKNICHNVKDAIIKHYRYRHGGPSWHITDASRWCSDAFQIAKCYLPPKGYDNKSSFADIDLNGTLGLLISNTWFQKSMTAQLNVVPNICSKARDMINESIRHSASYELSDVELAKSIDALRDLLRDPMVLLNDQHAKDAVNKLNQLQNNTLVIAADDITKVLEEGISTRISKEQGEAISALQDHFSIVQTESVAILERILAAKDEAIEDIKKTSEEQIQTIKQIVTTTSSDFSNGAIKKKTHFGLWDKFTFKEFRLRLEFQEELIRFYNMKESMIPASPLVEEYAVPLTDLYVQPPISAFKTPNAFGQGIKSSEIKSISSYRELFINDDKIPYKNIYVEANAGYGKTSFTQEVAMTWCQAHKKNKGLKSKFRKEDVDTLKCFDFLFLLHLRDFQGEDICNLDDLILKFVSKILPYNEKYSRKFIVRLLKNKTCLVICDGLDEWVHPELCAVLPGIPHNNYREKCTVLTTTRPWKLSTLGLPPNLIDRHLKISILDDTTAEELKSNAVKILSNTSGEEVRDLHDFDEKLSLVKLGDICLIPYILLQLICIWFDGLSIGKSKCETYSNTIEITLQRGLKKKNIPTLPTGDSEHVTVPQCMRHNALCNLYVNLLLKLGQLAFHTLFQKIKESSLIIESTTVLKFLNEQELEFCLKIGLLSQSMDSSKVSVKRYKVFFQHKSFQEFMAAMYITSEWKKEPLLSTIKTSCSSLSSVLEMENLFVFVCGMDPEVYSSISGELQNIVVESQYRRNKHIANMETNREMQSHQSMQLKCFEESSRNGNDSFPVPLHDILLDGYTEDNTVDLKTIIQLNKGNVKSLMLSLPMKSNLFSIQKDKMIFSEFMLFRRSRAAMDPNEFMLSLDLGVFTSLEALIIKNYIEEPVWLAGILTQSAATLKCLSLSVERLRRTHMYSLSDIAFTELTELLFLESLCLQNVKMTQSKIERLCAYIEKTTTLTQIMLQKIKDSDHETHSHDCVINLDLRHLNALKMLHLKRLQVRDLRVNPACLEKFQFSSVSNMTPSSRALLFQDLRGAPVLSSLTSSCQEIIQSLPTLAQLQHLKLEWIDEGDEMLRFSPIMTKLEHVELYRIEFSSAAWRELFLSLDQLPRNITIELEDIRMTSQEWRELLLCVGSLQQVVTLKLIGCWVKDKTETFENVIRSTHAALFPKYDLCVEQFRHFVLTPKKQ